MSAMNNFNLKLKTQSHLPKKIKYLGTHQTKYIQDLSWENYKTNETNQRPE
jgi:hypothetical protein